MRESEIDRTRLGGVRNCGTCLDTGCLSLDNPTKRRACIVACYSEWKPNKEAQAFIVRACNSHYDLVAACKALLHHFCGGGELVHTDASVMSLAEAAIAKATPSPTEPTQA